jgi:hypothetical protein
MNLPLVFDIATGLVFIYLILSLLASEIQEIIATLLQWRAKHLKEAIENMLTGENLQKTDETFTDDLYQSPLIKSLNQGAKGIFPVFFRRIIWTLGDLFRALSGTRNTFDEKSRSGPSYIPSSAFSTALIQQLNLEILIDKVGELTFKQFNGEKLAIIQELIECLRNSLGAETLTLDREFERLRRSLNEILQDYSNRRVPLTLALDQSVDQLEQFLSNTEEWLKNNNHCKDIIRERLPYVKQAVRLRMLEPTILEVVSLVLGQVKNPSPLIAEAYRQVGNDQLKVLPQPLKDSLMTLAKQAQLKSKNLKEGAIQLEREIELWFDNSMERASGVYRRNAKGVAILLGFLIASLANADTFHIVDRLSKDTTLRSTISQAADQVIAETNRLPASTGTALPPLTAPGQTTPPTPAPPTQTENQIQQDLEEVKTAVNNVLEGIPLPIGWNRVNVQQQLPRGPSAIALAKVALGWLISGIALSMGASFWFDLLSKVVRVRNSGSPPKSNG